jgi:hypothetical protein
MHSIAFALAPTARSRSSITVSVDDITSSVTVISSGEFDAFAFALELLQHTKSASILVQSSRLRLRDNTCEDDCCWAEFVDECRFLVPEPDFEVVAAIAVNAVAVVAAISQNSKYRMMEITCRVYMCMITASLTQTHNIMFKFNFINN